MLKKRQLILPFLLLILLVGCNTSSKDTSTYFGGKIINPKSKYVILYAMDKVIDTLYLDAKNKFLGTYKDAKEGLYYFVHGQEHQYFYLEPKDSLLLRLNSWDFDESLVFTGKGAERNNILIDCFLEDEIDRKNFYAFNQLKPLFFKQKADSLIDLKLATYNNYIKDHPKETKGYKNILNVALTYPIYARMERYPMAHVSYSKQREFPEINEDFYAFRKSINITRDSLLYYNPYSYYLKNFLYNKTYSLGHAPMMKEYSSKFTIDLLNTIDRKIASETSRNAFLKQTVIGHFYKNSSGNVNKSTFKTFFNLSTNKEDKEKVNLLFKDSKLLEKGAVIGGFSIFDFTNSPQPIKKITASKNSCLFFWNPEYVSKTYIGTRIHFLSKKYPKIQFIPVKIDGNNSDRIQKLDIKNQFFIDIRSGANSFLTSKMPRVILIDKKGKIVNGFASISSFNIHSQLAKLNNN
jgi:hypothetical protein